MARDLVLKMRNDAAEEDSVFTALTKKYKAGEITSGDVEKAKKAIAKKGRTRFKMLKSPIEKEVWDMIEEEKLVQPIGR